MWLYLPLGVDEPHISNCTLLVYALVEGGNADGNNNFQDTMMKLAQNLITPLLVVAIILSSLSIGPREQKQVSIWWKYLFSFTIS